MAWASCALSTLEVLQNYPSHQKTLLSYLGAMDLSISNFTLSILEYFKLRLSHHLDFKIHANVCGKSVHCMMIDEGYSTCFMSLSCWRAIGSPDINQSPTTLKAFDGRSFKPYGILNSSPLNLEVKLCLLTFKLLIHPFDYNFLLSRSWFYSMTVVPSSIFCLIQFSPSRENCHH